MIEWLKNHTESESKVRGYMQKTAVKRAAWIRENTNLAIGDILKVHPRLFDTPGMVSVLSQ